MADEKQTVPTDDTVLGGDAGVPGTAGSAAGGSGDASETADEATATDAPKR